jgi:flagellar basal body-associated protein FliL
MPHQSPCDDGHPLPKVQRIFLSSGLSRRALLTGLTAVLPLPAFANEAPAGPPKPNFLPLGEFTINLHSEEIRFDFVVVSVTLEVAPEAANTLRDVMPRLKEAVMRRLMAMADQGALMPGHVDTLILKTMLTDTLHKINPDAVRDVLITRILYG